MYMKKTTNVSTKLFVKKKKTYVLTLARALPIPQQSSLFHQSRGRPSLSGRDSRWESV